MAKVKAEVRLEAARGVLDRLNVLLEERKAINEEVQQHLQGMRNAITANDLIVAQQEVNAEAKVLEDRKDVNSKCKRLEAKLKDIISGSSNDLQITMDEVPGYVDDAESGKEDQE